MRRLSKAQHMNRRVERIYLKCDACGETFLNDSSKVYHTSIRCPNGCGMNLSILRDEHGKLEADTMKSIRKQLLELETGDFEQLISLIISIVDLIEERDGRV